MNFAMMAVAAALSALALAMLGWIGRVAAPRGAGFVRGCQLLSSAAAAVSAGFLAFLIVSRSAHAVAEILQGGPVERPKWLDFARTGLVAVGVLVAAAAIHLRTSRAAHMPAAIVGLGVMGVLCASFLVPTYYRTPTGGYVRSACHVILAAGLSAVLCVAVIARGSVIRHRRRLALRLDPVALLEPTGAWPGFRSLCGAVGMFLIILAVYSLAAPVEIETGGYWLPAIVVGTASAAAGASIFAIVGRAWSAGLADLAMGLVTLGVCSVSIVFLPGEPRVLGQRFPMIFSALIFGLAMMAWVWSWLSAVWTQQLDDGRPWTTAGHLVSAASDFSFQVAAVALLVGLLMAAWPMLPGIAASDDSAARMLIGIATYLVLLLVLLQCGRRTGRRRFTRLCVLAAVSLLIFLAVRAIG